ncbi:E3 ubiquitin-protein ligase huwe1 [Desmophyllum pertusum]|uniref:E3 ubiquitin-protein ligase huwe1 n=1 Tax=Desmophyllum pertusum TaxID=174260 RepID=A0A9W9YIZ8_9CNID|nr:E3 ubiquitin-protein ligase huwe1 [Desmophyllum pertusum]
MYRLYTSMVVSTNTFVGHVMRKWQSPPKENSFMTSAPLMPGNGLMTGSGRWYNYNVNNNTTIDAAYRNGDSRVRFMAGRRRYLVNFSTMVQVNEDSCNRRPIMLESVAANSSNAGASTSRRDGEAAESSTSSSCIAGGKGTGEESQEKASKKAKKDKQDKESSDKAKTDKDTGQVIHHLNDDQRLLLSGTQVCNPVCRTGGARALLLLTQESSVAGFATLATLLLRHVLEDEENLKHTMEKVVRSSATSSVSSAVTGVSQSSPGAKEINYILRVLGPAACRNAELFKEVATGTLRLAITPQLRRTMIEGGETNMPANYAQIVKAAIVAKPAKPPPVAKQVHGVVCDLLNVLCASDSTARTMDRGILMCRSDSQMLGSSAVL